MIYRHFNNADITSVSGFKFIFTVPLTLVDNKNVFIWNLWNKYIIMKSMKHYQVNLTVQIIYFLKDFTENLFFKVYYLQYIATTWL